MSVPDFFLNPEPTAGRLFDYKLRRDIRDALVAQLPRFSGVLLDVGCGKMPYRGLLASAPARVERYIGLDVEGGVHGKADMVFDGRTIPLADESVDCALATEVLEHCPEPGDLLREIRRVLKPGGFFFFTAPCFWPLHEVPHDYYRYTPFAMRHLLARAGFGQIFVRAHAGSDASLAQMIGLWLAYRGMRPWKRRALSLLAMPLVRMLNRLDVPPSEDAEGTLITGLSGTAVRPPQTA
jgi:SAM-dependent methyltransferase